MNMLEILAAGLRAEGFDGMVIPGECGCLIDNLSPFDCICKFCEAGYKHTHSVTSEWIVSSCNKPITDDEIARIINSEIYFCR